MKEFMRNYAQALEQNLTIEQIFLSFGFALLLGAVIYLSYRFSHSGAVYSARFNVSLLMMTLVTTMIMNVIGNNIALSLGMVGALSIVRFRTAIKDSRDTAYIFWCIAVGICCGVGYYPLASIGTGLIFLVMLGIGNVKSNDRYLLIVRADNAAAAKAIEEAALIQYMGAAILRVANRSQDTLEYIYELSAKTIAKSKKKDLAGKEAFAEIPGVTCVNLVCQSEEMSR